MIAIHLEVAHCKATQLTALVCLKYPNRVDFFVVIQAQSQEPSFPPSQVATQTYPYAQILVDSLSRMILVLNLYFL